MDHEPESHNRTGWATVMIGVAVVLAALFVLYLVLTAVGMFD